LAKKKEFIAYVFLWKENYEIEKLIKCCEKASAEQWIGGVEVKIQE
jgi:hypothetical protein